MKRSPILVTGANGLVGAACTAAFTEAGREVVPISRCGLGGPAIDLSRPFEEGLATLNFSGARIPEVIVHMAAAVPHDARYPDSPDSAALTRAIDRHVACACEAWGSRVIYMSSCSVYARRDTIPNSPRSPLADNLTHYAAAKVDGERLFRERDAAIFRLSAPVGANMRPGLVFSRFASACRTGHPIELWGTGTREQDFIHLDDICDLMLLATDSEVAGTYICARGRPVTMAKLAEEMVNFYGRGSVVAAERVDPLDGETARYDISDSKRAFGWEPRRDLAAMLTSFENGMHSLPTLGAEEGR
jgi:nucleoside-diphosphate-sugar epimerase